MITTKSGLKIFFKHSTVHALEDKAARQADECGLYNGFALNFEDLKEYNFLIRKGKVGRTFVHVLDEHDVEIYKGEARCDERDIYEREKGCLIALRKATVDAPYEERAELFEAFNSRKLDTSNKVLIDGKYYDEQVLKAIIDSVAEPGGRFSVIQKNPTYHPYGDGQKIGTV